jgi:hypothetical protein
MHCTLADLITDIAQIACEAGAEIVELGVSEGSGEFRFSVKDNGKGMTKEELDAALDPFVTDGFKHPQRKVGLGLPFLIQTSIASGGGWDVQSEKGKGTTASAWFDMGNVDTPPVGDIPGMFRTVLLFGGPGEIVIKRLRTPPEETSPKVVEGCVEYEVRKTELADALGGLEDTQSLILMDKYLRSLEESGDDLNNEEM